MKFNWDRLDAAVATTLESGKVGVPRSVRVTLHIDGGPGQQEQLSASVVESVSRWFGGGPASVARSDGDGPVSVSLLTWESGGSALVSISAADSSGGGDFILLGSNGSLYFTLGGQQL